MPLQLLYDTPCLKNICSHIIFYITFSILHYNLQVRKDPMNIILRMRGRRELDLSRRKQSMPPRSSGILSTERAGEAVESCL